MHHDPSVTNIFLCFRIQETPSQRHRVTCNTGTSNCNKWKVHEVCALFEVTMRVAARDVAETAHTFVAEPPRAPLYTMQSWQEIRSFIVQLRSKNTTASLSIVNHPSVQRRCRSSGSFFFLPSRSRRSSPPCDKLSSNIQSLRLKRGRSVRANSCNNITTYVFTQLIRARAMSQDCRPTTNNTNLLST